MFYTRSSLIQFIQKFIQARSLTSRVLRWSIDEKRRLNGNSFLKIFDLDALVNKLVRKVYIIFWTLNQELMTIHLTIFFNHMICSIFYPFTRCFNLFLFHFFFIVLALLSRWSICSSILQGNFTVSFDICKLSIYIVLGFICSKCKLCSQWFLFFGYTISMDSRCRCFIWQKRWLYFRNALLNQTIDLDTQFLWVCAICMNESLMLEKLAQRFELILLLWPSHRLSFQERLLIIVTLSIYKICFETVLRQHSSTFLFRRVTLWFHLRNSWALSHLNIGSNFSLFYQLNLLWSSRWITFELLCHRYFAGSYLYLWFPFFLCNYCWCRLWLVFYWAYSYIYKGSNFFIRWEL